MSVSNNSYSVADYIFDPLGLINPIEGKDKFKPDLGSPLAERILQVAAKAFMTLVAAFLTVVTLFIPFTFYCTSVSKEKTESNKKISESNVANEPKTLNLTPDEFLEKLKKNSFKPGQEITVVGKVDLSFKSDLANKLPENLTIRGDLNLTGCVRTTSLPENLTVEGNLILSITEKFLLPLTLKYNWFKISEDGPWLVDFRLLTQNSGTFQRQPNPEEVLEELMTDMREKFPDVEFL